MTAEPVSKPDSTPGEISDRIWTVPNILCFVRLAGALILIPIAWQGRNELFLVLFLLLAMTDWFDGKLAILLNQRTVIGARLDSWADAALFATLLFGLFRMYTEALLAELPWLIIAVGGYVVSTLAGFWKYGRWPSYHTRAAKTSWFFTGVAVLALFTDIAQWPLRLALFAVILTNIEAICITIVSPAWQANVTSLYHALKASRASQQQPEKGSDEADTQ